MERITEWTS